MDKLDLDDMDIEELRHCCPSPELVDKLRRLDSSPLAKAEAGDKAKPPKAAASPLKSFG